MCLESTVDHTRWETPPSWTQDADGLDLHRSYPFSRVSRNTRHMMLAPRTIWSSEALE